jgi:lipopolysaccharide transport system permease protein
MAFGEAVVGHGRASSGRRERTIGPPSLSLLGLFRNVALLTEYGDLILTLSLHRIKVRYKQSLLGWAWAFLQPLSLMAI